MAVPDDLVEKVAEKAFEQGGRAVLDTPPWKDVPETDKNDVRTMVRAVLEAYEAVTGGLINS